MVDCGRHNRFFGPMAFDLLGRVVNLSWMRWLTPCLVALAACSEPPPRDLVIRAGRLIDGSGDAAQQDVIIRTHDGVITAVEPDESGADYGAGVVVIDARDFTVLPGLVASHTQLLSTSRCSPGIGYDAGKTLRELHGLLRAGVTTAADLGSPAPVAVALRRFAGTGRHRGPRLLVSGPLLTVEGGYPIDRLGPWAEKEGLARVVRTDLGAKAAVRDLARAGVDLVVVALDDQTAAGEPLPWLSSRWLCTITREAHRQELRVAAHASTLTGWAAALACQVDAIVHASGDPLDETLFARAKAAETPVAPTLRDSFRPDRVAASRDNTRRLAELGVPVALGCSTSGSIIDSLVELEQAGLTRLQAIRAGTYGGARLLGLHDALGLVRPGYRADLIAVTGEPDRDLRELADLRWLMIDGVLQELDDPGLGSLIAGRVALGWASR